MSLIFDVIVDHTDNMATGTDGLINF